MDLEGQMSRWIDGAIAVFIAYKKWEGKWVNNSSISMCVHWEIPIIHRNK